MRLTSSRIPYAYFLRVPLILALVLLAFPFVSLFAAPSLLAGIFDLSEARQFETGMRMFLVAVVSLILCWTIMETFWLVILYGADRFGAPPLSPKLSKRAHSVLFATLSIPVFFAAFWESLRKGNAETLTLSVSALLGIATAAAILLGVAYVTEKLDRRTGSNRARRTALWLAGRRDFGAGYVTHADAGTPHLEPGHIRATLFLTISFATYVAVGIAKNHKIGFPPDVPTLACVVLLLTVLCWVFSGLAFFLDRYRVPVFLPIALLFLATSLIPQSDHFYFVRSGESRIPLSPSTVIRANKQRPGTAILVAASGGGIQASAWTARVLTGLEEVSRENRTRADFGESIRFISAVSGGSVATMYFVDEYQPGGLSQNLKNVVVNAEDSSLDDVAWGLIYPDLARTVFPFPFKYSDRGIALERAFTRSPRLTKKLSEWRTGVKEGWRPAVAFNSTIVDTGGRLRFSTTDFEDSNRSSKSFYDTDLYPNFDLGISTAVRMSATFPYVSPAARADLDGPQIHLVDGAYYDNYGVATLVEWLESALLAPDNPVEQVLIIQIRDSSAETDSRPSGGRGWFYQAFAPLAAMMQVRSTGTLSHDVDDIELLGCRKFPNNPVIASVVFTFEGEKPPLSWHLTKAQIDAIDGEWSTSMTDPNKWPVVRDFLDGKDLPRRDCATKQ